MPSTSPEGRRWRCEGGIFCAEEIVLAERRKKCDRCRIFRRRRPTARWNRRKRSRKPAAKRPAFSWRATLDAWHADSAPRVRSRWRGEDLRERARRKGAEAFKHTRPFFVPTKMKKQNERRAIFSSDFHCFAPSFSFQLFRSSEAGSSIRSSESYLPDYFQ